MTVAEALAIYGREHGPHVAGKETLGRCIGHLAQWWGDAPVSAVTAAASRQYAAGRGVKPGTARRELGTLSTALHYCAQNGYLSSAPPVVLPPASPARERWLTRGEAARLLWEARREPKARLHLPLFVLIGLYTGARKEAILGLQWQPNTAGGWVDLGRGEIDFRIPGQQTNKRRSRVPIPPRLLAFLRLARQRTRQHVIECDGHRIYDVKKSLAAAGERAGLGHVHAHILRHTAVSWLVQGGVDLWQVGKWVGLTTGTIERVYGHMSPDRFKRILDVLR